jgi:hypothetical protein
MLFTLSTAGGTLSAAGGGGGADDFATGRGIGGRELGADMSHSTATAVPSETDRKVPEIRRSGRDRRDQAVDRCFWTCGLPAAGLSGASLHDSARERSEDLGLARAFSAHTRCFR